MNAIALQLELRALMLYATLPPGCIAHLVTDAYSAPHIRPGEFVVVDTNDREVRHLETYVIQWQGGRRKSCLRSQPLGWRGRERCDVGEISYRGALGVPRTTRMAVPIAKEISNS